MNLLIIVSLHPEFFLFLPCLTLLALQLLVLGDHGLSSSGPFCLMEPVAVQSSEFCCLLIHNQAINRSNKQDSDISMWNVMVQVIVQTDHMFQNTY